jgi:hypothetical protein
MDGITGTHEVFRTDLFETGKLYELSLQVRI